MSRLWNPFLQKMGFQPSGPRHHHQNSLGDSVSSLPLYSAVPDSDPSGSSSPLSPIPHSTPASCPPSPSSSSPPPPPPYPQPPPHPHPHSKPPSTWYRTLFNPPTQTRFLADFTLGFADGLTVPFALTAGLASLGRTDTVLYAGMAEICAGSISMGIGGYLAARGEAAAAVAEAEAGGVVKRGMVVIGDGGGCDVDVEDCVGTVWEDSEKGGLEGDGVVARYLDPLGLPLELQDMVVQHIRGCPDVVEALAETQARQGRSDGEEADEDARLPPSSLMAGLSVALGYLVGGVLPLFPYFLVTEVKDGLLWSFVVCAVALFVFGFCKDFALTARPRAAVAGGEAGGKLRWRNVRRSVWEGVQMVLLGSVAALAAVICVRAFEGIGRVDQSEQAP